MRYLLTREGRDLEVQVEPDGAGYRVTLEGRPHHVDATTAAGETMRVRIDTRPVEGWVSRRGDTLEVELRGCVYRFRVRDPRAPKLARRKSQEDSSRGELHAPMPGLVVQVLAHEGEEVEAGHPVVVVEAMKMQNALVAPIKGRVISIPVTPGTAVESGQLLLAIAPEES
jgi:biotin carboxyl carrier protein